MRAETQWLVVCIFLLTVKSIVMTVDWTSLEHRLYHDNRVSEGQEIMILWRHDSETLREHVEKLLGCICLVLPS